MRISVLVVAAAMAAAPALSAQEPSRPPTFAAEATMVRLSVSVTAKLDRPLTAADFTVYDNGAKQDVTFFDATPLPVDITMFVDTSGSLSQKDGQTLKVSLRPGITQSVKRFVDILKPGDRMALVEFSHHILPLAELTGDKDFLRKAVGRLGSGGESSLLMRALRLKLDEFKHTPRDHEHPRRRVLVFLTDGVDSGSYQSEDVLRKEARLAEVTIYVLALEPNASNMDTAEEENDATKSRWLMQKLCQETGGAFLPAATPAELSLLARTLSAEIAAEYTIGWAPTAPDGKDRWHNVQVAARGVVSDRMRYRSGYLSAR